MVDVRADGPAVITARANPKPVLVVVVFNPQLPILSDGLTETEVDFDLQLMQLLTDEQTTIPGPTGLNATLGPLVASETVLANAGAVSAVGRGGA